MSKTPDLNKSYKPGKVIDLSYEDYEHQMAAAGLVPDVAEVYVRKQLGKAAIQSLNNSSITIEL